MTDSVAYDSAADTLLHIRRVNELLFQAVYVLLGRAIRHDATKLVPPEKEIFDEWTPKLKDMTYGSDEYKDALDQMRPALLHHYAANSHHPEHYGEDGVDGMDLFDVLES